MPSLRWIEVDPAEGAPALRAALEGWGYRLLPPEASGTALVVVDRPDPRHLPIGAPEVLWWVKEGTPEEVSLVLDRCSGWVLRQVLPVEIVQATLEHIRHRDLGSEGWLRQMLSLASLDELLRLVLKRAERHASANGGAIWIRQDETFYQRVGQGFPEAPLSAQEAANLVKQGQAHLLCASEQVGIIRLLGAAENESQALAWLPEVEYLLLNAWNLERSRALSFKDDLTVAQNRRALEAELPARLREAASRGEAVALLFLDVDNLKQLNSRFGHPTGSRVLTTVALEAQRVIRAQDRLYRYGGDEFCILINGATAIGAEKVGERLIQRLQDAPLHIDGQSVPVSVSVGLALFPQHADGAEQLIERADRALFKAKNEGKARVVVAG